MSGEDLDAWNRLGERGTLLQKAFHAARHIAGEAERPTRAEYPASVRVLAGAALFRGGFMPAKAAARDCEVGDQARLYLDEGLCVEDTGARLDPPMSRTATWNLLQAAGVETRPRGTQGAVRDAARTEKGAKPHRSTLRRHASAEIDPERAQDLSASHPALSDGRTIFPGSVVGARDSARLLVSGHNNPKLGKEVLKGPRAGWPIFQLTLEERATCPRSCPVWAGCYGNAMPFARRHRADAELMQVLRLEVAAIARQYPGGFLVRVHTLGDFFSVPYVLLWGELLAAHPQLHVFGYTARRIDDPDPETRKIAAAIQILTTHLWERFAIRTSHAEVGAQRSVVVKKDPGRTDVLMCPAQVHATEACATCGLCWAEAARGKAIGFLKHGMTRRRRSVQPLGMDLAAAGSDRTAEVVFEAGKLVAAREIEAPEASARIAEREPPKVARAPLKELPTEPPRRPAAGAPATSRQPTAKALAERVKPISANVVRWSRAYLRRGVSLDYLAGLFEVPSDDLAAAIAAATTARAA